MKDRTQRRPRRPKTVHQKLLRPGLRESTSGVERNANPTYRPARSPTRARLSRDAFINYFLTEVTLMLNIDGLRLAVR